MLPGRIVQAMSLRRSRVGRTIGSRPIGPPVARAGLVRSCPTAAIAVCVLALLMLPAQSGSEPLALTPDQLAIIASIAKPQADNAVGYAGAPTDPIGAQVRLPFGEGRFI